MVFSTHSKMIGLVQIVFWLQALLRRTGHQQAVVAGRDEVTSPDTIVPRYQ